MDSLIKTLHRDFFNLPLISSMHPVFDTGTDDMFRRPSGMPSPDIVNFNDRMEISIPAAGYTKDLINVQITDGMLCIDAQKNKEYYGEDEKHFIQKGVSLNGFTWRLRLGQQLNSDAIKVSFTDGMLRIKIPKKQKEITTLQIE